MANLREALKQRPDKTCAIMLDTKGPEIRTGLLVNHQPVEFVAGQSLQIVTDYAIEGDNTRIACSYRALPETVQVGSVIYVADGALTCEVTEIQEVSKSGGRACPFCLAAILQPTASSLKIIIRYFAAWSNTTSSPF